MKTKVMTFGTFDMIHKGHENLFEQARKLTKNPFLIVSVARDVNVVRIKKKKPAHTESQRRRKLAAHPLVDKVILGSKDNYLIPIVKIHPDIIALGYDQKAYVGGLKAKLKELGLKTKIVRLKSFKPKTYKTSLLLK